MDNDLQPFLIENKAELIAIKEIPEDFYGMPMSEYRLREMGFLMTREPDQLDMYFMGLTFFPDLSVTVNPVWTKARFCFTLPGKRMMDIKHVHELQNLIFDHTGQGVTVGLEPMP